MILAPDQYDVLYNNASRRFGQTQAVRIWPNAIVPFYLDSNFSEFLLWLVSELLTTLSPKFTSCKWKRFHQSGTEYDNEGDLREVRENIRQATCQGLCEYRAGSWMRFDRWILGRSAESLPAEISKFKLKIQLKSFASTKLTKFFRAAWKLAEFSTSSYMSWDSFTCTHHITETNL